MGRIEEEKRVVEQMIHLYCKYYEGNDTLCASCQELLQYARERLSRCPFGDKKSTCRKCSIHCYKPDLRERMRGVMRFAGPRMLMHYPIDAIKHMWREWL